MAQALGVSELQVALESAEAQLKKKSEQLNWALGKLAQVSDAIIPQPAEKPITTFLIFGPNGSGKGTQGAIVKKAFEGMAHIESGVIFRDHIGKGTELGKKAKEYINRGDLVPDDLTIPMVSATLKEQGSKGWLLDGFPRSLVQAEKLYDQLKAEGIKISFVVEILLPRKTAKERIMGRRVCVEDGNHPNNVFIEAIKPNGEICRVCGSKVTARPDDQDECAINKRHDIYYDAKTGTLAAAYFFKSLAEKKLTTYIELDGSGDVKAVKEALALQLRPGLNALLGPGVRSA